MAKLYRRTNKMKVIEGTEIEQLTERKCLNSAQHVKQGRIKFGGG
jgi:hypothetical protein